MKAGNKILLARHGLSLTSTRLAVLEALEETPHSNLLQIYRYVKGKVDTVSKQAIYNNLDVLVKNGIVREIEPKGSNPLYELQTGDNHHHLICKNCRRVTDTGCKDKMPCLTATEDHGFRIDEAEITFWGLCPSCIKQLKTGE